MPATLIDRGRITARVPLQVQQTLELAANMVGATVNQFIVQTALREAERIIEQEKLIHLSANDTKSFLDALENPPLPNQRLLKTLQDYAARCNDQTGTIDWTPQPKRV